MDFVPFLLISSILSLFHVEAIEVQGNSSLDEDSIVEFLGFTPPCSLSENAIGEGVRNVLLRYLKKGYGDARIAHRVEGETILLTVSEGDPYRIGRIEISGNRFVKEEIALRIIGLRKGALFSEAVFESGMGELLAFYGNRGFPFTSIAPVSFEPEEEALTIQLAVEEGPRLRWGKVLVQGNRITRPYVIQKQMRIPHGEYYSESALQSAYSWLDKLSFIEREGDVALLKGEKAATLDAMVTIRETRSNRISGMLGYLPPGETEKGGTVGIINTELLNLFGTARSLRVSWEKQIPPYTKLSVSYTEPWIFRTQAALGFSFYHLLEDTLYTISRATAEVKTDLSLNLSLAFVASWEKFAPATIALPPSKKYAAGTRIEIGTLDYAINPRKGILYSFYTEYGKKGAVNIMKFDLEMLNVVPLAANQSIALLIVGRASRTNDPPLPEYEQFPLGGHESLRGYRERQFRATQMLRVAPEYRLLLSRKSRLYVFYDAALFETAGYPDSGSDELFRYGYGIGAAFPSGIGILSIAYALGEEHTFLKGKIHLGLDTTF